MFGLELNKIGNIHLLAVVGRGGETQLQVNEDVNKLT